jgi:hypothetical protein
MNRDEFLEMKREFFECAQAIKTEDALAAWWAKYVQEFGNAVNKRREDTQTDDPSHLRKIREHAYFQIATMLCGTEAAIESIEEGQGPYDVRKTRLFVLTPKKP